MLEKMHSFRNHVRNLGVKGAFLYNLQRIRCQFTKVGYPYKLYSKHALYPLICRPYTSDYRVFWQVFINRQFACLDSVADANLIIDCGANVGYSSAYFLSRYPRAIVIAVEPDFENFSTLAINLSPYHSRARLLNAAIWSHPTNLTYVESTMGLGKEWARRLYERENSHTPGVKAIDIGTLLQQSGMDTISILKVDVEGSEESIFASDYEPWLNRVENIVIELHGKRAKHVFMDAIAKAGFGFFQSGELGFYRK